MMNRTLKMMIAAAVISAPVLIAPAITSPAAAQANLSITIGSPPPVAVYEVVPPPRTGYVWAPGHYRWIDGRYVWTGGQWIVMRPGYRYVPDRWERIYVSGREQWRFVPSRWDRDGDGVPDRYERHGYYQGNHGPWGDRDHDGIPNANDRHDNRRW